MSESGGLKNHLSSKSAFQRAANYSTIANGTAAPLQRQAAPQGGLPNTLKSGIESLSGIAMDDVRVHYNSSKPAQLQAHAYAQGTDIHIAPGQERHLPHEAWHVVQQKQGRVKPTLQLKGVAINDDSGLEREADVMGAKSLQSSPTLNIPATRSLPQQTGNGTIQGYFEWQQKSSQWLENKKDPIGKYFFNNKYLDTQPSLEEVLALQAELDSAFMEVEPEPIFIPFKDCLFRVQNPNDPSRGGDSKNPNKSKVSETKWSATTSSVDATIEDYGNINGNNQKLWLSGTMGLVYVGINAGLPIAMTSQIGLDDPNAIVTIILPSAFKGDKLAKVYPSSEMEKRARLQISLTGLAGELDAESRLWVKFAHFKDAATKSRYLRFIGLDGKLYAIDFAKG